MFFVTLLALFSVPLSCTPLYDPFKIIRYYVISTQTSLPFLTPEAVLKRRVNIMYIILKKIFCDKYLYETLLVLDANKDDERKKSEIFLLEPLKDIPNRIRYFSSRNNTQNEQGLFLGKFSKQFYFYAIGSKNALPDNANTAHEIVLPRILSVLYPNHPDARNYWMNLTCQYLTYLMHKKTYYAAIDKTNHVPLIELNYLEAQLQSLMVYLVNYEHEFTKCPTSNQKENYYSNKACDNLLDYIHRTSPFLGVKFASFKKYKLILLRSSLYSSGDVRIICKSNPPSEIIWTLLPHGKAYAAIIHAKHFLSVKWTSPVASVYNRHLYKLLFVLWSRNHGLKTSNESKDLPLILLEEIPPMMPEMLFLTIDLFDDKEELHTYGQVQNILKVMNHELHQAMNLIKNDLTDRIVKKVIDKNVSKSQARNFYARLAYST